MVGMMKVFVDGLLFLGKHVHTDCSRNGISLSNQCILQLQQSAFLVQSHICSYSMPCYCTLDRMMIGRVDGTGIVGFAWALNSLGKTTASDLALLGEDACGLRYYVWPMLGVFILAMFFTTMFIIANALQDPLGSDLDDYDVDALLLSTEASLHTLLRSKMIGTAENSGDVGAARTTALQDVVAADQHQGKGWVLRAEDNVNPTFDVELSNT